MTLNETDWEELLQSIQQNECTPFIGAGGAGWLEIGKDMSSRWATEHEYPFRDSQDLKRVSQYLAIVSGDVLLPKKKMATELGSIHFDLNEQRWKDSAYEFLAALNLPIYITTNYDRFMELALKSQGKDPVSEFCRWNKGMCEYTKADTASVLDKGNKYQPSIKAPLVYHLHGVLDEPGSLLLTDDDYLNFLSSISTLGAEIMLPPIIRDVLASNLLLFIGYSLEDINFRLILRLLSGLNTSRGVAVMLPQDIFPGQEEKAQNYIEKHIQQMFSVNVFLGAFQDFAKKSS